MYWTVALGEDANCRMTKVLNRLSTVLILGLVLVLALTYHALPPMLPTHYGVDGVVDGWSNKGHLWYWVLGGIVVNIGLLWLGRRPDLYNYPVPVTSDNRERLYTSGRLAMATLRLMMTLAAIGIIATLALSLRVISIIVVVVIVLLAPLVSLVVGAIVWRST